MIIITTILWLRPVARGEELRSGLPVSRSCARSTDPLGSGRTDGESTDRCRRVRSPVESIAFSGINRTQP